MKQADYLSEAELQRLIASHPCLLGSCTAEDWETPRPLLLIKQEMGVPAAADGSERWSMDHFYIDSACVPTLVEVKRSKDQRIRREVVGQMLDYAANAVVYWGVDQIKARFEKQWGYRAAQELETFLVAADLSPDDFWRRVEENLTKRNIRMVFVADELPAELKRIIEFLNEEMQGAEVLGLELRHFTDGKLKVLAPSLVGRTSRAEAVKGGSQERKYPTLDAAVEEFRKLTDDNIRVSRGNAHYRQIRLAPGVDAGLHYEFLYSARRGAITCEFHVENGRKPKMTEAMNDVAQRVRDVGGVPLVFDQSRGNGLLRVVPKNQDAKLIAQTMLKLIQVTQEPLSQAAA
ncbi:hypothetical protein [Burkholderia sp. Ac-20353]|uniref:hypothetical protein n=1 Tax=Burkholderia sp. Ac-20353 TaxID=2703894 RepID=UPI00197C6C67|nr:hypothetical protein [Burkholderia sp. Ac-20353]MBN3792864.1 hypothetical protein [Burkholderia sp. Ac-20353]